MWKKIFYKIVGIFSLSLLCPLNGNSVLEGDHPAYALERPHLLDPIPTDSATKQWLNEHLENYEKQFNVKEVERLYRKGPRHVGDRIVDLAILSRILGDPLYKERLQEWCEAATQHEDWDKNNDITISHLLFALAVAYDWYKDAWSPEFAGELKQFLYRKTKFLYEFASEGKAWANSYWQNHCWINYTAMLASGMALAADFQETKNWIDLAQEKLQKSVEVQAPEGSNHEGIGYSVYGNTWLVRGMTLLKKADKDIFQRSEYLKNYYRYFQSMNLDDNHENFFDVGDTRRYLWGNPCEFFVKLAQEYQSGGYANLLDAYCYEKRSKPSSLFSAVYGVGAARKAGSAAIKAPVYFAGDLGLYIEKSYKQDEVINAFLFKSGVPGGAFAFQQSKEIADAKLNSGHDHPDANHFMIWQKSGYLIANTGYTKKKFTRNHNSLVINDVGQLGEGAKWLKGKKLQKKNFTGAGLLDEGIKPTDKVTIVRADAAPFYPDTAGLKKFRRTIVWIKPVGFVIFDQVVAEAQDQLMFSFHSDFKFKKAGGQEFQFVDGEASRGEFFALYPLDSVISIKDAEFSRKKQRHALLTAQLLTVEKAMTSANQDFVDVILPENTNVQVDF